jgi:hypothetical protein
MLIRLVVSDSIIRFEMKIVELYVPCLQENKTPMNFEPSIFVNSSVDEKTAATGNPLRRTDQSGDKKVNTLPYDCKTFNGLSGVLNFYAGK